MLNLKTLAAKILALVPKPLQPVLKAIVGAVVSAVSVALATGQLDWKALVSAVVGAALTYLVPNVKPAKSAAKS